MLEAQRSEPVRERAAEYLDGLSTEDRRRSGQVYTPEHLVDFILEEAGYSAGAPVESATLLEPACGAGAFLERAVAILAARLGALGISVRTPTGRDRFLAAVSSQFFGVDVDREACRLARVAVRNAVQRVSPGKLPERFFTRNILTADFLTDPAVEALAPVKEGGFAFAVGNPPYVSATRIEPAYKEQLRSRYATATGRLDLYTVFMERSMSLLRRHGRLALVTPDKFLVSQTARALRGFILQESAIRTIAQFQSHKVFEDAATVPCVTVLERQGEHRSVEVLTCDEEPPPHGRIDVVSRSKVPQASLSSAAWHLVGTALDDVARRIRGRHPTLASRTARVSAGPATGRDGVYVLPREESDGLESELLRPAVRGRDIDAYRIRDPELRVLVPYVFDALGTPSLADLSRFPKARRYLEAHRSELKERHCVRVWGKPWYDLHDQVLVDLAKQPKIVVPDVASSNRFAVDPGKYLPLHSVYYLIPKPDIDPHFLCAILNSRMAEFLIRLLAPVVKDGFSRYRQQFLAVLPVPDVCPEEMSAIGTAARDGDAERADQLVTALFRPTDADLHIMEQYLTARAGGSTRDIMTA